MKQGNLLYNRFTAEYVFVDSKEVTSNKRTPLGTGLESALPHLGSILNPKRKTLIRLDKEVPYADYESLKKYFQNTKIKLER